MITLNKIKKLLKLNQFSISKKDIVWGHSDIIQFRRGNELINIQYQREEKPNQLWSVCFDELELIVNKYVDAKTALNKYNGCETIDDFILLCKFARGIKLVLS
jgi:hypothetical protein